MNDEEFRTEMESFWESVVASGGRQKDAMFALDELSKLYRDFNEHERQIGDRVISGWVTSDSEGKRFDALFMIGEFQIVSAVDALRLLSQKLTKSNAPGAPFELQKVRRILSKLGPI
jgi:hypothetical protein